MNTYYSATYCARLAQYLIAYNKPFCFDGTMIEFTASPKFVEDMQCLDKVLAKIDFVIK